MSSLWEQASASQTLINLGKGHPNPRLLPLSHVHASFNRVSSQPDAAVTLLQYGRMQGNERLCSAISNWVGRNVGKGGRAPREEEIVVTTGSGPGFATVAQLFTRVGDVVLVDDPGFFLMYATVADCGLRAVGVGTDGGGMDVGKVEELLKGGLRPRLVYTVPFANNPTGVGMTEERKRRLVQLAREYGFKIVADEVYMFLRFGGACGGSLFEYEDEGYEAVVFAVNSFSKLLGPGLRVGWIATREGHVKRLLQCGALQSGGGFNPFASAVVAELLENGEVERQAEVLRREYGACCGRMCEVLEEYVGGALGEGEVVRFERPEGGFFVFVELPRRFDSERLLEIAKGKGVSFFAGTHFSVDKERFRHCLRLCFAFCEEEVLVEGVRRLGEAVRAY